MKKIILIFTLFLLSTFAFANNVKLKITNVKPNEGKVIISIHGSKDSFKNHTADKIIVLETTASEIETSLELPEAEFAFSVYQDLNSDGKLNANLVGIPKEPFGFSNYNGKSVPGNFERHKVLIKQDSEVVINLYNM
ncbi:MAG: DUF2141 domain-containing protein [Treponema sp.]|nr:DUF2141 domain-containing protein [Treponema sp.]